MTVSAPSDRYLSGSANLRPLVPPPRPPVIELRQGGRALGGSYLYEGDGLITGWHSHEVHQIEYALHGVVEVETDSAHYLLPPQQAAWIPVGPGSPGGDESRRQDRGGDVRPRADSRRRATAPASSRCRR